MSEIKLCIVKNEFKFKFDFTKCNECGGKCCTGESGYIWINKNEIDSLIDYLSISFDEFTDRYLKKIGFKYSLKEKPYNGGFACIFFDEKNKNCSIYELRPTQCKTFPFWDYFKKNYDELEKECIGVSLI